MIRCTGCCGMPCFRLGGLWDIDDRISMIRYVGKCCNTISYTSQQHTLDSSPSRRDPQGSEALQGSEVERCCLDRKEVKKRVAKGYSLDESDGQALER